MFQCLTLSLEMLDRKKLSVNVDKFPFWSFCNFLNFLFTLPTVKKRTLREYYSDVLWHGLKTKEPIQSMKN